METHWQLLVMAQTTRAQNDPKEIDAHHIVVEEGRRKRIKVARECWPSY